MHASAPPVMMRSAHPDRSACKAYPAASEADVHPVETTWLIPRRLKAIEISLDNMPTKDATTAYGLILR
jgi:hypothetical protein